MCRIEIILSGKPSGIDAGIAAAMAVAIPLISFFEHQFCLPPRGK